MKELELILAAITQLGEAGKEAFIWYLLLDKGLTFLGFISCFSILGYVITYVARIVNTTDGQQELERLRDLMGVGSMGGLTKQEYRDMLSWVEQRK